MITQATTISIRTKILSKGGQLERGCPQHLRVPSVGKELYLG